MRRENIQSKLLFGLCVLVGLCGCNSFLDVQPKGTVEQGKQFKDVQGYRDAMYGIYASMAQTSLYGKAMSYGFIDQVGQLFYDPYNGMTVFMRPRILNTRIRLFPKRWMDLV
ncbi:MAG: hypothetical protein ACLU4N_20610 [Butyricimonas faecihominis]